MKRRLLALIFGLTACGGGSGTTECVFLLGDVVETPDEGSGPMLDTSADTTIVTPVLPKTGEIPECSMEAEPLEGLVTAEMLWPPEALELEASREAIGVTLAYAQDSNDNSTAYAVYREVPDGDWVWAHPLSVDRSHTEMRGSLVGLKPGTAYEVRVAVRRAALRLQGRGGICMNFFATD